MQIHGDAIRFGVHAGPQNATFDELAGLWRRAEDLGYDWVSVFDHFRPIFSDPTGPIFEGPTMMAALAARTSRVRVAILVTGVTYRHPAIAANIAATIDHISGGRAEYGVGAAWFELEHDMMGIPFPRIGVRMDMLDEACRIMRGLWTEETFSFTGEHYTVTGARLEPKPVQERLPLVIGGAGEKRTLRIVAEHADVWNGFLTTPEEYAHKLGVLRGHCADAGRPYEDIRKSLTFRAVLASDEAAAQEKAAGMSLPAGVTTTFLVGTPAQCAERIRPFLELGAGDFLLACAAPYDDETIELVATEVAPALRG
jgi:F420-dependent oxidoreductase-like protein